MSTFMSPRVTVREWLAGLAGKSTVKRASALRSSRQFRLGLHAIKASAQTITNEICRVECIMNRMSEMVTAEQR
jgi:hypothetical protein